VEAFCKYVCHEWKTVSLLTNCCVAYVQCILICVRVCCFFSGVFLAVDFMSVFYVFYMLCCFGIINTDNNSIIIFKI